METATKPCDNTSGNGDNVEELGSSVIVAWTDLDEGETELAERKKEKRRIDIQVRLFAGVVKAHGLWENAKGKPHGTCCKVHDRSLHCNCNPG